MPLDLARRVGVALDIRSNTRIRQIDRALKEYVRLTPQSPTVPSAGNIDAAQVISGTLADARISESSVTQHEAALLIDWMQLDNVPATFPPSAHNHNASDLNAGTLADARVQQSNVTQHQAALTLAATQLTSGVLANARVQQSNVTQHEAALSIDWLQLDSVPSTFAPSDHLAAGSWTPVDSSGAGLSLSAVSASYSKHEKLVVARCAFTYPATADATVAKIGGLPFNTAASGVPGVGIVAYSDSGLAVTILPDTSAATFRFVTNVGGFFTNAQLSGKTFYLNVLYVTA